jgi:hypothetical protein
MEYVAYDIICLSHSLVLLHVNCNGISKLALLEFAGINNPMQAWFASYVIVFYHHLSIVTCYCIITLL